MKVRFARAIMAMAIVATFGVGAMVGRFATRSVEAAAAEVRHAPPFASEERLVAAHREPAAPARRIEAATQPVPAERRFDAAVRPTSAKPEAAPGKPEAEIRDEWHAPGDEQPYYD